MAVVDEAAEASGTVDEETMFSRLVGDDDEKSVAVVLAEVDAEGTGEETEPDGGFVFVA